MIDPDIFHEVLGEELRDLRNQRGLTRKQLQQLIPRGISHQTLATYEHGTRQCTMLRFVEICLALDELPHHLLTRVHERVTGGKPHGVNLTDLRLIINDDHPQLEPLRRWAQQRLDHHPAGHTARAAKVHLDFDALQSIAELCDMKLDDLFHHLHRITGDQSE